MPAERSSYSFTLDPAQQQRLLLELRADKYESLTVPHTTRAVRLPDCNIALYQSGKMVVQGKGAREWIEFTLEPQILGAARLGYETRLNPELHAPHMGIDESGKGDFFGPLVIAAVYIDPDTAPKLVEKGVRDSKTISGDRMIMTLAEHIRETVRGRFTVIAVGPQRYNEMYAKIGNLNRLLAWGHARAIENVLEKVPDCPRALSDKFGPTQRIESALMERGRKIRLDQRTKAESDPAVAAASILARDGFVRALQEMGRKFDTTIPKGASEMVRRTAENLIRKHGPGILRETCKLHFKTTDDVLGATGFTRADLAAG